MFKNILFVAIFFFIGCATSSPNAFVGTSTPLFITNEPMGKNTYIQVNDIADNNIKEILADKLTNHGYIVVPNEQIASIIVKMDVNYLQKKYSVSSEPHGSLSVGFGVGSRGYTSTSLGLSFGQQIYPRYASDFGYMGQVGLLIVVKSQNEKKEYTTNLNFQTDNENYTYTQAKALLNEKITNKIIQYLGSNQ